MGLCFSANNTGLNSKNDSPTVGNVLSSANNKVSAGLVPQAQIAQTEGEILQSSNLKRYTFAELRIATGNFRPDNVLGEGGFGTVFKGWIDETSLAAVKPGNGIVIAVKRLNREGFQGHREWLDYNAKLSDFGLSRDGPEDDETHVSTRVMGTYGYADPEYVESGHLTTKSDVYSYGVVLLEILSGRRAVDKNRPPGEHKLVEWAKPYLENKRKVFRVLDSRLERKFSSSEAYKVAALALQCLSEESKSRPSMDEVVRTLQELMHSRQTRQN